ncbi:MAG: hypothetical protein HPZ91_15735 [Lentisphaeria bacterium]|nr:hypothetical protein [Lentisphaeria bacterium]
MNPCHEIDKASWPRRSTFEYYRTFENQLFNITLELNVEAVYRRAKAQGRSFFLSTLYPVIRAVNAVPAMRQRILDGGRVVEFRHTAALTPILGGNDVFTMALAEYAESFDAFFAQASEAVAAAKRGEFDPAVRKRQDCFCASCVPWYGFTALNQAALTLDQSIVILAWGKMNRNFDIPLSLQLNHALVDGRQVGHFVDAFNGFAR